MAARTRWTEQDAEAFEALARRLVERAADIEDRFPLGGLTAADRDLLVDGFDWVELDGDDLIRRWAQAIGSRPDIRSIDPNHRTLTNFRKQGRSKRRARLAQEENAMAVAEASMKRRNRPSARGLPDGIDPEAMINSGAPVLMAAGFLLRERPGRLWYDDFYKSILLDWNAGYDTSVVPPYEGGKQTLLRLKAWLRSLDSDLGSASDSALQDGIETAADYDHRNEPADWLNSLAWDGTPRIEGSMARIFKAPDTALNRAIGRNLFIGLVARILRPGCKLDTMVVLRGGQGIHKSSACDILGGKWYAQSHANVDSKDFVQELRGLMILEVAELHSFLATRTGSARIKAMLSVREDRYRTSYGRVTEKFPRTLVLVGTTNDRTFHNDPTGGRRFWIVDVGDMIDIDTLAIERDQLFAEAVKLFKDGATWWEVPADEQEAMVSTATSVSYLQEVIEPFVIDQRIYDGTNEGEVIVGGIRHMIQPLAPSVEIDDAGIPSEWGSLLTLQRVAHWLKLTPRDVESGMLRIRLTEAIRALGFESYQRKVEGERRNIRLWLRKMPDDLKIRRASRTGSPDDMPF